MDFVVSEMVSGGDVQIKLLSGVHVPPTLASGRFKPKIESLSIRSRYRNNEIMELELDEDSDDF